MLSPVLRRLLPLLTAASLVLTATVVAPTAAGADGGTGDGTVLAFGSAPYKGSTDAMKLARPIVGMAATPTGQGYWLVASDGGIFSYGDAAFFGSTGGMRLNRPIVGIASTPTGRGYWLVASDGGIFSYGDAAFFGSTGGMRLNRAVVGMAATPTGRGYWLVASDGGIFSYGDAPFLGSTGGMRLNRPVVGMAATPTGRGYWLVASDGGIFSYGDAPFKGSAGSLPLRAPVTAMAATTSGQGYWLAATDGGIFAYGDAGFAGSGAGQVPSGKAVVAMATAPGGGYWLAAGTTIPVLPAGSLTGASMAVLQRRLNELGYWVPVSGSADSLTQQAAWALEKVAGLPRNGTLGSAERSALERAVRPTPRELYNGIEVDKTRQVVLVIRDGGLVWTFNTSTGSGQTYSSGGSRAVAYTPEGHFAIYRQVNGTDISPLGTLYRPKYFTGGYALHGSPSIPPYPASHGCVRLSNGAITLLWDSGLAAIGTPVYVYH